jgi:hypothetical protein
VAGDLRQNQTIVTAWSYSDINKLYNAEVGEWNASASAAPTCARPSPATL